MTPPRLVLCSLLAFGAFAGSAQATPAANGNWINAGGQTVSIAE